jgi:beta-phosphoglucomutase family hydrolase
MQNITASQITQRFQAVLFDLDGVLTATAKIHSACWKKMFDEYLQHRAQATGEPFIPFSIQTDYKEYVDGKPRYDGVCSFLASRGITLPEGMPDSAPDWETVCGLGNHKKVLVNQVIETDGVEAYEGSVAFVRYLSRHGIKMAVVSSSKGAGAVLDAVDMTAWFAHIIDGNTAVSLNLAGKPAPDTFLKAVELLGVTPEKAVVVEDAISGVQAGKNGGFGLVIGVNRADEGEALLDSGAHIVVEDLNDLLG